MRPLLSISLLVSDRVETVEKCLDSLVPILRSVPSELIIVYTGFGQECLEIARRYTDQIIPYIWCDDFSAARNCGLERAAGEWFLYIDDDEWFEDCSEVISFFKNGEYKKYLSACYTQRNYIDWQGKDYEDISVTRLVKCIPELKFLGKIHEKMNHVYEPEKMLSAFVHHYGYIKKGNINLRFERNRGLLEKEIEQNPECIQNYLQLAQEYLSEGMYADSESCCRKILNEFKDTPETYYLEWAAVHMVKSIRLKKEVIKALEEGMKIFESGKLREAAELSLLEILLPLCNMQKQFADGVNLGKRFISNLAYLKEKPELWQKQQILTINQSMILKGSLEAYKDILVCAAHEKEFELITECLSYLPWTEEGSHKKLIGFLEWWKQEFSFQEREILHCLVQLTEASDYLALQKALLSEGNSDKDSAKSSYYLIGDSKDPIVRRQSINLALRQGFSILPFVEDIDLSQWKALIRKVAQAQKFNSFEDYKTAIELTFGAYPAYQAAAEQIFLSALLLEDMLSEQEFIEILHRYCEKVLKLNHILYKDTVFEKDMQCCLPVECRVSLEFSEVLGWMDGGDFNRCIRSLKNAVVKYPDSAAIAKRLINYIAAQIQIQIESEVPIQGEFTHLGQAVKEQLRILIETGDFQTAYPIAEQLCELLPNDLEVLRWKQKIMNDKE